MTDAALVSVIMPSRNQADFIAASLDSIFTQDYPEIEVIVADGASSDGTLALLNARAAREPRCPHAAALAATRPAARSRPPIPSARIPWPRACGATA